MNKEFIYEGNIKGTVIMMETPSELLLEMSKYILNNKIEEITDIVINWNSDWNEWWGTIYYGENL